MYIEVQEQFVFYNELAAFCDNRVPFDHDTVDEIYDYIKSLEQPDVIYIINAPDILDNFKIMTVAQIVQLTGIDHPSNHATQRQLTKLLTNKLNSRPESRTFGHREPMMARHLRGDEYLVYLGNFAENLKQI